MGAIQNKKNKPRDRNKTFNTYEELFKYIQKRRNEKENIPHSEKKRRKSDKIEHTKNKADENSDDEYDSDFEEEPVSPDAIQYIEKKVDENSDDDYDSEFEEEPVPPEFIIVYKNRDGTYYFVKKYTDDGKILTIQPLQKKIKGVFVYKDLKIKTQATQLQKHKSRIENLLNEQQFPSHVLHLDNDLSIDDVTLEHVITFYNSKTPVIGMKKIGGKRKTKKAKKTRKTKKSKKTKKTRNPKKSRKTRKARLR